MYDQIDLFTYLLAQKFTIKRTANKADLVNGKIPTAQLPDFVTPTELTNQLSGKQDVIDDLNTIRQNANAGASTASSLPNKADLVNGKVKENQLPDKVNNIDQVYTQAEKNKLTQLKEITTQHGQLNINKITTNVMGEFDGVKYYHKREFNLIDLWQESPNYPWRNLLTGAQTSQSDQSYIDIHYIRGMTGQVSIELMRHSLHHEILYSDQSDGDSIYTSRAWIPVDTMVEVDQSEEDNKICLPGIIAYYGYINEDHTLFISYWNEATDVEVDPITIISDGNKQTPIHDNRLTVTAQDIGKIVGVNDNGELSLIEFNNGTQLYRHTVYGKIDSKAYSVKFILNSNRDLSQVEYSQFYPIAPIICTNQGISQGYICSFLSIGVSGSIIMHLMNEESLELTNITQDLIETL